MSNSEINLTITTLSGQTETMSLADSTTTLDTWKSTVSITVWLSSGSLIFNSINEEVLNVPAIVDHVHVDVLRKILFPRAYELFTMDALAPLSNNILTYILLLFLFLFLFLLFILTTNYYYSLLTLTTLNSTILNTKL